MVVRLLTYSVLTTCYENMNAETLLHPNYFLKLAHSLFAGWGVGDEYLRLLATLLVVAGIAIIVTILYLALSRLLIPKISLITSKSKPIWDDIIFEPRILRVVAELLCVIIVKNTLPEAFAYYHNASAIAALCCRLLLVWTSIHLILRLLQAGNELLEHRAFSKASSLKGIRQMLQVVTVCVGIVITISILANKDPLLIVSGLGAAATVLMLVFKDSIMGVVAGVQLTLNDMLRPGDWISVPSRNINGVVLEVGLNTVKVQNFDMTIITVPPYALVTESFQNWRGMYDVKGRRIMRSVTIDVNTVTFCTPDMIEAYMQEPWGKKLDPAKKYVNLTLFRKYLEYYISGLPSLMTGKILTQEKQGRLTGANILYMVRELEPTPNGVPVEIYMFTSHTEWKAFEHLQAEIVDHILASVSRFDLRVYQSPSGYDVLNIQKQTRR